jgi:polysaccharide export outer membrane protein
MQGAPALGVQIVENVSSLTRVFSTPSTITIAIKSVLACIFLSCCFFINTVLAQDGPTYILDTGDKIYIQVFDEQDLTMETRVGSSGVINYSFLGQLQVSGRTSTEMEGEITTLLKDGYLVNPSVNVTVVEYRPFYINGEVKRPGGYPYQPGLTLEKAVAIAGGLTDRASKRKMYLQQGKDQDSKKGKVRMDSRVSPGDIITIEEGFF